MKMFVPVIGLIRYKSVAKLLILYNIQVELYKCVRRQHESIRTYQSDR